ncbi:MAG: FAD binding domain-containing protein [Halanaerobiaceae bacterium]
MFKKFDYQRPDNLEKAVYLLKNNDEAEILAGGTDLLLTLREETSPNKLLIDIKDIDQLKGIKETENYINIGALTTIREIEKSNLIKNQFTALREAALEFGCLEIRNKATIGGNIVHASPGAESGTPLFAAEAEVEIIGPQGKKVMPINEFWEDVGKVNLAEGEMLSRILIPKNKNRVSRYKRISRVQGMDLAVVGVTVLATDPFALDHRQIRIAMGAVARTPYRNHEVEEMLSKNKIDKKLMAKAKTMLAENISPRSSSLRASPAYKKAMVGNLTEQCLQEMGILEGEA